MEQLYSIYDSASESFSPPMVEKTKGAAVRRFENEVNNPQSMLNQHPSDYTLFHIGEWDNLKGRVIPLKTPVSCGLAIEFLKKDEDTPLQEKIASL
jgi:hypothetical protein